jgi:hypothetical protein
MSLDERFEALAMHLEALSRMHEDLEKKHEQKKGTRISAVK